MFTSLASLGLLIGGLGRIGMSILNFLFNYLLKRQEIKLKELSLKEELSKKDKSENSSNHIFHNQNKYEEGNNPSSKRSINTCTFKCKFDSSIIEDKQPIDLKPLEIEQPKRFYFITIIFTIAVIGVIGATILMYLYYGDLNMIQKNINNLFDYCFVIIGFIVSWVLTDKATNIMLRR